MAGPTPPFQRFLDQHEVRPSDGCWIWKGHKYQNGYGCIKVFGKTVSAHRYSYELHKGPIPKGAEILHSCDNRDCVNPDHLRAASHAENMAEASERGRMPSGKNHWMSMNGNPNKGAKSKQAIQVKVLGKSYGSLKEAERALSLGSGTVAYWLKNHPHKAQIISKKEYLNDVI